MYSVLKLWILYIKSKDLVSFIPSLSCINLHRIMSLCLDRKILYTVLMNQTLNIIFFGELHKKLLEKIKLIYDK